MHRRHLGFPVPEIFIFLTSVCIYKNLFGVSNEENEYNGFKTNQNNSYFLSDYKSKCWYDETVGKSVRLLKCLPYFYLIGAPKCGTTDLQTRLVAHPLISEKVVKEPHWINRRSYVSGDILSNYIEIFSRAIQEDVVNIKEENGYHPAIFGDCSASTMWDLRLMLQEILYWGFSEPPYTNADIIQNINPLAKIILILRNPTESLPPRGSQMSENQIKVIKRVLPEHGNLLIWGLGYDSQFWHYSTSGRVTFIEDDTPSKKAGKITHDFPFLETYRVHYKTRILESFDKYIDSPDKWHELDLSFQLPRSVALEHWHVIVVDAPVGCYRKGPGRYQSIYTSAILAREGTHIFVDDFERKVEHEFSKRVLGKPIEVVHRSTRRNSIANQQAHFIRSSIYFKYLRKRVHRG